MSYSSNLTKERILNCAMKEFCDKGYNNTNIRNIAKKANVTTGAIYNHFENKENLFANIISDVAENLFNIFERNHCIYDNMNEFNFNDTNELFDKTIGIILNYFYDFWDEMKLLFLSSDGSKFANFCDRLIFIEEKSMLDITIKKGIQLDKTTSFFIHVISSASIEQLVEVVRHDLTKKEAIEYMKKIQEFYSYGIEKMFD